MHLADKNNDVLCFVCWYDYISLSCIVDFVLAASRSLKSDVSLTLIDLLRALIRFKRKDLTDFTHSSSKSRPSYFRFFCKVHSSHKNFEVIISIHRALFTVHGTLSNDLTEKLVFFNDV